ncbi:helix-turn-helix transcriptional regulator [Synechococcus sp. PCC 7336]|uniref:helix-turn-helix domain-containing protein n=1 Tax=Synechococcus sp. PCC 7336 TaxID=195250 RepID=UPI0003660304|nr:helix-turn-helix transcriptional regulator [Synechococcus sp. PCC 7336]
MASPGDAPPLTWIAQLEAWKQQAGRDTWKALAQASNLSRHRIQQLRAGAIARWPLEDLLSLCLALQISLSELAAAAGIPFDGDRSEPDRGSREVAIVERSQIALEEDWQREALHQLEPLLRQWPTALYAARHHNLPASQLLGLLAPLDRLLRQWEIFPLGQVGQVTAFDPSWQQPLSDEPCESGTPVSIRYIGYRWRDKLWLRAQVKRASIVN